MAGRLPTFLVIGAMRSGTTSLARYLGVHPDVFMAPEKEVHFFDRHWVRGVDWYRERFAGATTERAVGEATPAYLHDEAAPARIAEVLPQVKLVVLLRDPVDRAYSHYWLERSLGREPRGFAEAVREGPRDPDRDYLGWGEYLPQLQRFRARFPPEAMLVLLFEEFSEEPRAALRAACRFLDVHDRFVPPNLGRRINRYRDYRSLRLRLFTRRPPPTLFKKVLARLNATSSSYPPLDPEVRQDLVGRFRGRNAELAAWLGRDLSAWER